MAIINYHTGNIFELVFKTKDPNALACIPHVCNVQGGWGAGFVLAISKLFPVSRGLHKSPEADYREWFKNVEDQEKPWNPPLRYGNRFELGEIQICTPNWDKSMDLGDFSGYFEIVNMLAQDGFKGNGRRPLRYSALVSCMEKIKSCILSRRLLNRNNPYNTEIHCPKFGAGLGGGNWDIIEELIEEIWVDNDINVHVYEYK